ncbi:MAG: diguanylate cyclase [Proteobacteria bacterium]|nr:diguanylate cyclase [Pseudomonadota bacterium]
MRHDVDSQDLAAPAAGQSARRAGRSQAASLHDQLYRYAEDMEELIDSHSALEIHCENLKKSSARLMESSEVFDELMRTSHDIHIVTDTAGTILHCNPAVAAVAPPLRLTGEKLQDWVLPSHHNIFLALQAGVIDDSGSAKLDLEMYLRRQDGAAPPLIVSGRVLAVRREGEVNCLHWILRDVTYLRETEFESQISSMVFKSASEGVVITDMEGQILAVNPAFSRITGYSAEEAIGRNPRFLNSGLQDAAFYADFWRALLDNGNWQGEIYNRKKNGEIYPEWLTVSAARDSDGHILTYIAVFSDMSLMREEEKRLAHLAHYDSLTDLPNRLLLKDRLQQTLSQARRFGLPFTLIFIDLDRFKEINDLHGHQAGDQVLREAAKRLGAAVREVDTVARLGGDEFVILAPGLTGDENIGGFCTKILEALSPLIPVAALEVGIGGSFGCAEYPRHGEDEVTLMGHADAAMYQAKATGGDTYVIYDPSATYPKVTS